MTRDTHLIPFCNCWSFLRRKAAFPSLGWNLDVHSSDINHGSGGSGVKTTCRSVFVCSSSGAA